MALRECAHLFCSSCIREHINQPGGTGAFCPNCRQKKAFDAELVAQPALEAAANHWRHARYVGRIFFLLPYRELVSYKTRPFLMKQWRTIEALESNVLHKNNKQLAAPSEDGEALKEKLEERAKRRLRPRKRAAVDDLDGEHVDYRALDASTVVLCPICQHEFDAATLNEHLDRGCGLDDPHPASSSALSSTASSKMDSWLRRPSMTHQPCPKRLTRPQYQLKSEKDLRKMLEVCL